MFKKYTTKNSKQTQNLGEKIAKEILAKKIGKTAVVLCLWGDLGAGKTTFLQGFAKGLSIKEKILSPTFILMKKFKVPKIYVSNNGRPSIIRYKSFYHIDCYRLHKPKEVLYLGFKEIIKNPKNIIAIEWPERIKKILPKKITSVKFEHIKGSNRELTINK